MFVGPPPATIPASAGGVHAVLQRRSARVARIPTRPGSSSCSKPQPKWSVMRATDRRLAAAAQRPDGRPEDPGRPDMVAFLKMAQYARAYPLPTPIWADIGTHDIVNALQKAILDPDHGPSRSSPRSTRAHHEAEGYLKLDRRRAPRPNRAPGRGQRACGGSAGTAYLFIAPAFVFLAAIVLVPLGEALVDEPAAHPRPEHPVRRPRELRARARRPRVLALVARLARSSPSSASFCMSRSASGSPCCWRAPGGCGACCGSRSSRRG